MPVNLENSSVATGLEKVIFHVNPKERQCQRIFSYRTIALISLANKIRLKILLVRLLQYLISEVPDVQRGLRKGRETRNQIANIHWILEKAREFQKKHWLLLHWLCQSIWLCGSQQAVENSSRDGNTRPPYLPPEKSVCRSRSNS